MKKKTALIILYCLLVLIVAAFVYQLIVEKGINSAIIRKALIPFVICVSAIVRVSTGAGRQGSSHRLYAEQYGKELGSAFTGEGCKKQYNQLMDAIGLYNRNQFVCGQYEKAILYAEKALELKNNLYQASNTLCLSYCALQKEEESHKYFQISVANGADAKTLREAFESVRSGAYITETWD